MTYETVSRHKTKGKDSSDGLRFKMTIEDGDPLVNSTQFTRVKELENRDGRLLFIAEVMFICLHGIKISVFHHKVHCLISMAFTKGVFQLGQVILKMLPSNYPHLGFTGTRSCFRCCRFVNTWIF